MFNTSHTPITYRSVLATLRTLIPDRDIENFDEAKRIAEHQAAKLLTLHGITTWPVPVELIIEQLPKIRIEYCEQPVSGATFWNGSEWVIQLNRYENKARQRFSLAHEYKHIIDHGRTQQLYGSKAAPQAAPQASKHAESAADYFAACLLMPKVLLKRAFFSGIQKPSELAELFGVSPTAMAIRLEQTGITERAPRCHAPVSRWMPRAAARSFSSKPIHV